MIVDIKGTGPAAKTKYNVAFRTELDALPMPEATNLEYATTTKAAHMCGHDGHMVNILGMAQIL